MYEMTYDLLVNDESIQAEAQELWKKAELFEQNLGQLVTMLEGTVNDAIIEGKVATNLTRFLEEVRSLQTEAEYIASEVKQTVEGYIEEIDRADNYIY